LSSENSIESCFQKAMTSSSILNPKKEA